MSNQIRLQPTLSLRLGPEAVEEYSHISQTVLSRGVQINICEL